MDQPVTFEHTTLQSLLWPTQSICTERELYFHCEGAIGFSDDTNHLHFAIGGVARTDTYFNLFNIGKWHKHCDLENIQLALQGRGKFVLSVILAIKDRSAECLISRVITLTGDEDAIFDLSQCTDIDGAGVLYFELRALEAGELWGATWITNQPAQRRPNLALSITTFKREEIVQKTAARFDTFIKDSPLKDDMHLFVVDNGQSAGLVKTDHMTPIDNENLGGSGGFARGLIEAKSAGYSHCLFMDDDASIHMESLERTWLFLAYAIDPNTAISGALMMAADRGTLWENGSIFDGCCHGQYRGLNLRNAHDVIRMEIDNTKDQPDNFYGAWWYFAFPLDGVVNYPFPFFVRGDDINFSLVHDFNILTLNGVTSFQDVDFLDKETPQVLYLDMRSFLANSFTVPEVGRGKRHVMDLAMRFTAHPLLRWHYETAAAQALGMADAFEGPEFFVENADMSKRRADIKAKNIVETWKPIDGDLPPIRYRINPHNRVIRMIFRLTLNGMFIPFFSKFGNHIIVNIQDRSQIRLAWGASQITYVNEDRTQYYTVKHDKAQSFKQCLTLLKNLIYIARNYDDLVKKWQDGHKETTGTDRFWTDRFKRRSS